MQVAIPKDAVDTDATLLVSDSETFNIITDEKELEEITLNGIEYLAAKVILNDGNYFTFAAPVAKTSLEHTPGGTKTNPVLWLKANDGVTSDGTGLTGWEDKGKVNEFTLEVPENKDKPTITDNSVNFNPTVGFDNPSALAHYDSSAKLVGNTKISFTSGFAVYKDLNGALVGSVETINYGANILGGYSKGNLAVGTGENNKYRLVQYDNHEKANIVNYQINSESDHTSRINGEDKTPNRPEAAHYFTFDEITPVIGATQGSANNWNGLVGDVAEIILYDQTTANDATKIESYLAIKYGITLNDGENDYVASNDTKMWTAEDKKHTFTDGSEPANYLNRITGIGRDDASGLNQKQSKSIEEDASVTIALGDTIKETNVANDKTFTNDISFFTFSDNGKDNKFSKEWEFEDKNLLFAERAYIVEKTNFADTDITIAADQIDGEYPEYVLISKNHQDAAPQLHKLTDGQLTINSSKIDDGGLFQFASIMPQVIHVEFGENDEHITVQFDQEVTVTDKTGFSVKVGEDAITLGSDAVKVDDNDPTKIIITLPENTNTDDDITVSYNGEGNLKGKNGVPVAEFTESNDAVKVTMTAPSGNIITTSKPTFEGTATPGATVKVKISDDLTLEIEADENGDWSVTPEEDLLDGEYTVEITAEIDGKKSKPVYKEISIDTNQYVDYAEQEKVEEIAPENVTYDKDTGKFKVPSNIDEFTFIDGDKRMKATKDADGNWKVTEVESSVIVIITEPETNKVNTAKPTFKGTATPGATVTVEISDTLTLTAIANANGNWSVTPNTDLPNGEYDIEVTATKDGVTSTKDTKTLTIATVDKAQLQARVDMSEDLTDADYTSDSWTAYENALDAAKTVLNNPNATQEEINTAYNNLKNAQDALERTDSAVDKSKLEAKVEEEISADDYTPASWQNYEQALDNANAVLNDEDATQEEIDQALEALTIAQNALIKKGGLGSLTPSGGTLSPSFSNDVYNYSMNVGNGTSEIDFLYGLFDGTAEVTMTANGVKVTNGKAPLKLGQNTIVIKVEDTTGTKTYTITVNRASSAGGGGSSGGGGVTPPTGSTTEIITVDLEVDGESPIEKTPVEIIRTTNRDGTISDRAELTLKRAQEAVNKALEIGNTIARIVLPDVKDEVDLALVEIPAQSVKLLKDNGIDLEIYSNDALITLPQTSMEGIEDDFYFRLVPVKKKNEQQAIEDRAKLEEVVRQFMGDENIYIVARPMTIETNLSSRPVTITLPLRDIRIPTEAVEREKFLKQLGVYIEHSDGEKEVVVGNLVEMPKGGLGLQFSVTKFSTFTILNFGKDLRDEGIHIPYIKGFTDGKFRPNANITRYHVALMIARNLGYVDGEGETPEVSPFKDLPLNYHGVGAVALMKELGIMEGDNGNFRGSDYITRAQMAKVTARYMELEEKKGSVTFTDTDNQWFTYYVEAIRDAGVITGYEDGSFRPHNNLTRAHAVKMLNRMFERGPLYGDLHMKFPDVSKTHWAYNEILEAATYHNYSIDEQGKEWLVNK